MSPMMPGMQPQQPLMAPPDGVIAQGTKIALAGIQQQLGPVIQMLGMAYQVATKKMPQPPMDPAVDATFKAAMAEIERKKQVDAAEQRRKDQEVSAQPMLEEMQRRFETNLELERMRREEDRARFDRQVELLKNEQDNKQHQLTELLKNRDDNETRVLIAQLQQSVKDAQQEARQARESAGPSTTMNFDVSDALQQALKPYADNLLKTQESVAALGEHIRGMSQSTVDHQQAMLKMAMQLMQGE